MSNWISVVVILGLIVVGVMVIHLVNGQRRNRIAGYSFGRSLWEPPNRATPTEATEPTDTDADTGTGTGTGTARSHGLHRLSGLISGRDRRRRKATR
ncbi:hypothetical protein OIE62_22020 [Streptomyces scopuliridis]|uniref:Uncharacterized protein n=1 Tax=Streptomyces scopuliridis TaxID=452529 RepID=A0ACD4ZL25_9ACTN|nr:hypothetical protein [Streptomyces scopuliridis]WSB34637.1 hypothetical protein OG949_18370 [Streptomyces scopuliridis]WSB98884.1 hypothetical protein OG835_18925 [Streptomyces scopuliridis]WSC07413.1 hypothetical protein OIE62_22020 [Streptomyces scopuliridis]